MKRKLITLFLSLIVFAFLFYQAGGMSVFSKSLTAFAVGDLTVDWLVPSGNPIFNLTNMVPGQHESHNVIITNNATLAREVGVRAVKTAETGNISEKVKFKVTKNGAVIYGGDGLQSRTLAQFITDSSGPTGIFMAVFQPGEAGVVNFDATFDGSAGDEYQGKNIVFDIEFGISSNLPSECNGISFSKVIYGTQGNNSLVGTKGNDLIYGLEGSDRINGAGGDDCIVGGLGDDKLDGSVGNDVLLGQDGTDDLNGNSGNDKLYGGDGNDKLDGSTDSDTIYGGNGNDTLEGGTGNDSLSGEAGNDILKGGVGNDTLIGGDGSDSADGSTGINSCQAEIKKSCQLSI
jgi:Ca2+-binding RTX toxin-like protein